MASGGQKRIEGSPCEKIRRKSRKQNNSKKQIEEESVVRKSVRQQPKDRWGQSSEGEQRKMEGKLEWRARIRKNIAHRGLLSEKMRIQARLSDS